MISDLKMAHISYIPSPPLSDYIYDLYYIDGRAPYPRLKVFPMPVSHLILNLGDDFRWHRSGEAERDAIHTESCWVGLWSQHYIVDWPPSVRFFGVHFKPGGAYPFLQFPLSELHNQVVSLDMIWGEFAAEIQERLDATPTIKAGLVLLERLMLARLGETLHGLDLVQYAVGEIVRHIGVVSIRALSDRIGISQNHLGTQFKRIVGVPTKELTRFYRFAHVLRSIDPTQPVDWARLAQSSHFYDQSHFNKDFVEFTGYSPGDYLRRRRHFHAENPEQAQDLGYLPVD
jgi:AraC-like DNA-binding protein